jgi:hypothetical protein
MAIQNFSPLQLNSTLTVGVDDTSHDVTFFGATSGKKMLWDQSADTLIVDGTLDVNGNADISGNITSAGWTGDVIASAYLDADTMHLSGTQTVGGNVTFSGDTQINAVLDITNTTEATDSSGDTGALKVEGGGSFAKHLYAYGFVSQMGRAELDHSGARLQPLGPYTTGKEVFSINPTWSEQQLQDYFDHSGVTWATEDDAPAGYSILIEGGVSVGIPYSSGFPVIPIDDTSVYFTECWIKNVGTAQTHYMGTAEKKADFGSPASGQGNPGSYGYHVMSNQNPGNSWTRVTGHITGRSDSASGAFETDANYFSPLALFNYGAGSGTRACIISGWRITKIDKQEYFADGTAALPSITNYNDTDTGIYWNAANELSLTTGGTNRLTINSTRALFSAEVEAASLDINGDADISGDLNSATWRGDVIASSYLDTDTAHLTTAQTFTGAKTFNEDIIGQTTKERWIKNVAYVVAAGTTEYFIPMVGASENTNNMNGTSAVLMPAGGRLLKAHIKANTNLSTSSNQVTVKMVNWDVDEAHTGSNDSIMCAVTQTGPTTTQAGVFDFTGTLDSGIGAESADFTAGELLAIGIKHSQDISTSAKYFVTLVFEMDWDSY